MSYVNLLMRRDNFQRFLFFINLIFLAMFCLVSVIFANLFLRLASIFLVTLITIPYFVNHVLVLDIRDN